MLFLDLLELGHRDGRTPTETIASLANLPDRRLPVRLHLLAAHLQNGLSLEAALARVPHLLPASLQSMLQTGLRHGSMDRTLAVCRQSLIPQFGRTQATLIYLTFLGAVAWLGAIPLLSLFRVVVLPKFQQLAVDLSDAPWTDSWQGTALNFSLIALGAASVIAVVVVLVLFQRIGGSHLRAGTARLQLLIPWQRDRLHRDFAAMLALLLDAGVPEATALEEAGAATGNPLLTERAEAAACRLRKGETLPQAIRLLDPAGEFRWRLENARHGSLGQAGPRFTETMRGWLQALDARATQREANAAQTVMCCLILMLGFAVGLHCAGIMGWLVAITEAAL